MKGYEPSRDFVTRVMGKVHAHEASRTASVHFFDRHLGSRMLTYAMSWCGALMGIFFAPVVCL